MTWLRCYHFKLGCADEVKAFKCLTLRKGIISLGNAHEVILNFGEGNNLPRKCKGSYSYLEKGNHSSRNSQKRLASRTEHRSITASARLMLVFQFGLKRSYFRKSKSEAISESPKAKLPRSAKLHGSGSSIPRRTYSSPKAGLEVKLNSIIKEMFTFTYRQSKQFKVFQNLNHSIQIQENLEGGLVDTRKR